MCFAKRIGVEICVQGFLRSSLESLLPHLKNYPRIISIYAQVASLASLTRSATSPSFTYVSSPAPDRSLCRAAAPRSDCVRFSCCSAIGHIRFGCCSSIASPSTAAPRMHLLVYNPSCSSPSPMFSNIPRGV